MANMSYCRFQNTVRDLADCRDHLYEALPDDERSARVELVGLCFAILGELEVEMRRRGVEICEGDIEEILAESTEDQYEK